MTLQANTVDKEKDTRRAGNFLVAMNDAFWCPYRLAVKTFLEGQKDALSHLTTIRNLLDEMRDTMRREQDIALGVCQKTFEEIGCNVWLAKSGPSEANAIFERAIGGLSEFGDAWMKAQMRPLDVTRPRASDARKRAAIQRPEVPIAAE
jgi:hypothetical protein